MGRGSSELQKTILVMARENRDAYGLGPAECRVLFDHPGLWFEPPPGFARIRTSDRYAAWVESRSDPGCLAAEDRDSEALRKLVEELAKLRGAPPDPDPSTIYHLSDEEEDAMMRMVESLDDTGVFADNHRMPVLAGGTGMHQSTRVYHDHREAERIVELLKARGFEARVKFDTIDHADLYTWEVLGKAYGFDRHRKIHMGGASATHRFSREWVEGQTFRDEAAKKSWLNLADHRFPGGKFYDVEAIGPARYNAAKVATSKAFHRLEERGLAFIYRWSGSTDLAPGAGIKLTAEGVEVADRLMVNRGDHPTTVSQYDEG